MANIKHLPDILTIAAVVILVGVSMFILFTPKDGSLSIVTGIAARLKEPVQEDPLKVNDKCFDIFDIKNSGLDEMCLIVYDNSVYNMYERMAREGAFSITGKDCGRVYLKEELIKFPDIIKQLRRYRVGSIC